MNAPKKIWLRWGRKVELIPGQIAVADKELDHEYIRADLVNGLVKALNLTMPTLERLMFEAKGSYGKNFTSRCETDIRNYEIVRDALKALEE
jgi:hypothetical protein